MALISWGGDWIPIEETLNLIGISGMTESLLKGRAEVVGDYVMKTAWSGGLRGRSLLPSKLPRISNALRVPDLTRTSRPWPGR